MAKVKKAQIGALIKAGAKALGKATAKSAPKTAAVVNRMKSAGSSLKNTSSYLKEGKGGIADPPMRRKIEKQVTNSPGYKKFSKEFDETMSKFAKTSQSIKKLKNLDLLPTAAQKNRYGGKVVKKSSKKK